MNLVRRLTPEWIAYIESIMGGERQGFIKAMGDRIYTNELTSHLLFPGSTVSINIMTAVLNYIASAANRHHGGDVKSPKVVAIPHKWYDAYVVDKYLNGDDAARKILDGHFNVRPDNFDKIFCIIVPILRKPDHWTLGVIYPQARGFAHLNSEWPLDPDENISQLRYILQVIKGADYDAQEWGLLPWFYYSPRQACEGDSGVCAIANAECAVLGVNPRESWDPIDVRDHKRLMVGALLLCRDYSKLVRMGDV
ncbi:hypothetical protein QBC40DRAFT_1936 [Triangularia verruculosa]|uniref:Ubiquitin-like protease family profile domain-containing protein n=1 Tax=Triangularia verruculosa TaxID=2587418 RepID=A0AAN6XSI2_9PEZI|nr:hypothetical protein QBC40DRAFT_1936 [Triangularia verruculosa]